MVYDASQLNGLFASTCCGVGADGGRDAGAMAEAAAGKIWSARFEGVMPQPGSVAEKVEIGGARSDDLPAIERLLVEAGLPTDVAPHLDHFVVARYQGRAGGVGRHGGCAAQTPSSGPWQSAPHSEASA